jgi:hypothetical protein
MHEVDTLWAETGTECHFVELLSSVSEATASEGLSEI